MWGSIRGFGNREGLPAVGARGLWLGRQLAAAWPAAYWHWKGWNLQAVPAILTTAGQGQAGVVRARLDQCHAAHVLTRQQERVSSLPPHRLPGLQARSGCPLPSAFGTGMTRSRSRRCQTAGQEQQRRTRLHSVVQMAVAGPAAGRAGRSRKQPHLLDGSTAWCAGQSRRQAGDDRLDLQAWGGHRVRQVPEPVPTQQAGSAAQPLSVPPAAGTLASSGGEVEVRGN